MQLIVHGGAGTAPADPESRQTVLDEAAAEGASESTPLSAVCSALGVLERDERFNAGHGGAVQSDGVVRTDAGVMTDAREVGAVAGMSGIRDAVTVARGVLERTPHVLLVGDRAVDFAADCGVDVDCDLVTERTRARYRAAEPPGPEAAVADHVAWVRERFGADGGGADPTAGDDGDGTGDSDDAGHRKHDHDTVGAVASDGSRMAAATSTAGRWFALAGRVGDVPQVGSGFYCSAAGGASATGAGEDIARVTLARRAVQRLEAGADAETAAADSIAEFADVTGSHAGVVVLDADGGHGAAFNTETMQTSHTG